jgi:hypothetical protein
MRSGKRAGPAEGVVSFPLEGLNEIREIRHPQLGHGIIAECPERYTPDGHVAQSVGSQDTGALECVQDHGSGEGSYVSAAQLREIGGRFSEGLGCRAAAPAIGSVADGAVSTKHLRPVSGRNLNRLDVRDSRFFLGQSGAGARRKQGSGCETT